MFRLGKRWAVLGAVGGVLALGAVVLGGGVLAQTSGNGLASQAALQAAQQATPQATPAAGQNTKNANRQAERDSFLNSLAQNLGVDRAKLDGALKKTADDQIDAAVKSGKLTQAQADALKQKIAAGQVPFGPGIGRGDGETGGIKGAMGPLMGCIQSVQAAVSKQLGNETADQIRAELRSGKTVDQIAQEHGTTTQALQDTVANTAKPCLDQAVTAGTITAQQEQAILSAISNAKGLGILGGHFLGGMDHGKNGAGAGRSNNTSTQ